MGYRDPVSKKMISRARYDELIDLGLPAEVVGNGSKRKAMIADVAEDTLDQVSTPPASAKMKPGAKKVIAQSTEAVTELIAGGIKMSADRIIRDERKQLDQAEAKSIGAPIARIAARHVPDWLKKYMPKGSGNDDITDLGEIAATLAKWIIRGAMITVQDYQRQAEARKAGKKPDTVEQQPAQTTAAPQPAAARPESNGHAPGINPLVAAFGADLGVEGF